MRRCPTCNKSVRDELMVCPRCGRTLPLPGTQPPKAPKLLKQPRPPAAGPPPRGQPTTRTSRAGSGSAGTAWQWLRTHPYAIGIAVAAVFLILALVFDATEWGRYFHVVWVIAVGVTARASNTLKKRQSPPPNDQRRGPGGWNV
jgi:hypothetical protein